jgi:hypothetical protein
MVSARLTEYKNASRAKSEFLLIVRRLYKELHWDIKRIYYNVNTKIS